MRTHTLIFIRTASPSAAGASKLEVPTVSRFDAELACLLNNTCLPCLLCLLWLLCLVRLICILDAFGLSLMCLGCISFWTIGFNLAD